MNARARRRGRPYDHSSRRFRSMGSRRRIALGAALVALGIGGVLWATSSGDEVADSLLEPIEALTLPLRHEDIIRQQANEKDVDADLIAAIIYAESRFRDQTSSAGARGLMQITPGTAEIIEDLSGGTTFEQQDLADPDINIRYGTFYLKHLLDKFEGNETAAIAAYNAGETNVAEWGGSDLDEDDIEFEETRGYVDDVLDKREDYRDQYAKELGLDP